MKISNHFKEIESISDHYNINKDLFGQACFKPNLELMVEYSYEKVNYGNKINANQVIFIHLSIQHYLNKNFDEICF